MKIKPLIVGAFLLAPVIGAVAGQNMSAEPIKPISDVSATLPDRPVIASNDAVPHTRERLPDHYAMETPEGRVEVHELAMRGRYADRYHQYETWRPDVDENLAMLEAEWDDADLDARAAAALEREDVDQGEQYAPVGTDPAYRPRTVANYSGLQEARTGEAPKAEQGSPPVVAAAEPRIAKMRVINVADALANQR
ncbi:hypothetical protein [Aurantiacibacter odishensis]|uniref:hypothetical protein n=1 Tax=Aurantiacibacter odishensis TaxID=1155476 RepID=UPI000E74A4A2|nr:hypothetical protein [Aurantiacibacter odishensis]